jgi:hypothetical protein
MQVTIQEGASVPQWLRLYATSRKVAGSRPDKINVFNLPATLGPGVHSAYNRNEYQKQKKNVSGE